MPSDDITTNQNNDTDEMMHDQLQSNLVIFPNIEGRNEQINNEVAQGESYNNGLVGFISGEVERKGGIVE